MPQHDKWDKWQSPTTMFIARKALHRTHDKKKTDNDDSRFN